MFHVELRQFPHATRAFNLSRAELDARVLVPWIAGRAVELDDHRWAPDRAKLAIYEGPALATEEMGMGRGWANVTRSGEDVTARLLAETRSATETPPALEALKRELLARVAQGQLRLSELPALASRAGPGARASERLALAEQAVWELLHEGRLTLLRGEITVDSGDWRATLLRWDSWSGSGAEALVVAAS
jgi:hypothetical protein